MKTDIYKSQAKPDTFLFVVTGEQPHDVLSESDLAKIGKFSLFKTILLEPDSLLIGADPKEALQNIKQHGYHLQRTQTQVHDNSVSEAGAAVGGGILVASLGGGPVGALIGAVAGYWLAHKKWGKQRV